MLHGGHLWDMYTGMVYITIIFVNRWNFEIRSTSLNLRRDSCKGQKLRFDWSRLTSSLQIYQLLLRWIFISILIYWPVAGDQIPSKNVEGKYAENITTTKMYCDMSWFYATSYFDLWYCRPFDEIITIDTMCPVAYAHILFYFSCHVWLYHNFDGKYDGPSYYRPDCFTAPEAIGLQLHWKESNPREFEQNQLLSDHN